MKYLTTLAAALVMALSLGAAATEPGPENQDWVYRVQPGDTLWDLSRDLLRERHAWQQLVELNGIRNDRTIPPGTLLRIPRHLVWEEPASVVVQQTSGDVQRRRSGGLDLLHPGEILDAGDAVVTGAGATALLQFENSTRILVLENSELQLRTASVLSNRRDVVSIRVLLTAGEVEIDAHRVKAAGSYFLIETPSAYATTRGTRYRVRAQAEHTIAEVTLGAIAIANTGGGIHVRQGFGVRVSKDETPAPPQRLLSEPDLGAGQWLARQLPYHLEWPSQQGAVAYRLQLATQDDFSSLALDRVVHTPALELPASLEDGVYYLRLAGIDTGGLQGHWSHGRVDIEARHPLPRPDTPLVSAPEVADDEIRLSWTASEHAAAYQVQLARRADFSRPLLDVIRDASSMDLERPRGGKYFVRVRGLDPNGQPGDWSAAQPLEIPRDWTGVYFLISVLAGVLLL